VELKLGEINYWAVLVAGIGTFMLGGAWYTALFGKMWTKAQGYTETQVKEMQSRRPPAVFFGGMILSYLVVAFVVAVLAVNLGITSAAGGAVLGLLVWLGPAAAIGMTGHIASNRSIGAYLIDASFQGIFLVVTGALVGAWQ
jgi:hypothetical protein